MRRMYSEQELTNVIKAVFEQELEDGALDENVSDAVDAYLVEHPVDITALEGQDISCNSVDADATITGAEIIEKMSGYSFTKTLGYDWTPIYVGICKNGNKLTFVVFGTYTFATGDSSSAFGQFTIPNDVSDKLYPYTLGGETKMLDSKPVSFYSLRNNKVEMLCDITKPTQGKINVNLISGFAQMTNGTTYVFRIECTFLLSENLIS